MRRATLIRNRRRGRNPLSAALSSVQRLIRRPYADEPIGYRLPGETLAEGMFLIWPLLGAADLGALRAGEGRYSRIWKERLREEVQAGA